MTDFTSDQARLAAAIAQSTSRSESDVFELFAQILQQGWRIEPPLEVCGIASLDAVLQQLQQQGSDFSALLRFWREREEKIWGTDSRCYQVLAKALLKLSAPFIANEVLTEGLARWPTDLKLQRLQGLALARSGFTEAANRQLREVVDSGDDDYETQALLARTYKDLGLFASDPTRRRQFFSRALEWYSRAYHQSRELWPGINAAAMALLVGHTSAREMAEHVREQCQLELSESNPDHPDHYWRLVTMGEAELIRNEFQLAEKWYSEAAQVGAKRLGDLQTSRRNADMIGLHWNAQLPPDYFRRLLRIPAVAVFAGHMIDLPNRRFPRFPPELIPAATEAIRKQLQAADIRIGFSSGASGGDLIFLTGILEPTDGMAKELHVVLPYGHEQFRADCVARAQGAAWGEMYDKVLRQATNVIEVSNQRPESMEVATSYANLVLHGLSTRRAAELQTPLIPIALWDGFSGDGPGGTADVVQRWKGLGLEPIVINCWELLKEQQPASLKPPPPPPVAPPDDDMPVMTLLFADAVHFSRLTESQVPRFVQHFLGAVADLLKRYGEGEIVRNTWGDGIYLAFPSLVKAGLFALDLCELVSKRRWSEYGLPPTLNVRVALHSGPVYRCKDPVTGQMTYTGTHVSRAARIEPITPPGQVYASDSFAALAAAEGVAEFRCDYVKLTAMPKGFGTFPTYLVRKTADG